MPCVPCQKNRRRPLSPSVVRERQARNRKEAAKEASAKESSRATGGEGAPPASTASDRTASFVLQTVDGRTQAFGSRLEASAARVRAGGGRIHQM